MKAARYESFSGPVCLVDLPVPDLPEHAAVIEVGAAGMCRSDWHGWLGHDPDIVPPIVPGHEWAGRVRAVGAAVRRWSGGERVTAPFVCGCGDCEWCRRDQHQVCPEQTQPGFTHDGAFADLLVVHHADVNLVPLPDELSYAAAAALGCRFATAYRAVRQQAHVAEGTTVAVHGCGGVGLSAVMIAASVGAHVVAVDIDPRALALAGEYGAQVCLDVSDCAGDPTAVGDRVIAATGGAQVSLDALGSGVTAASSVCSLARQGRHVQVGLLPEGAPALPMGRVIAEELELVGSHGMSASTYPAMLTEVASGRLHPDRLVTRTVGLEDVPALFPEMSHAPHPGITIIEIA